MNKPIREKSVLFLAQPYTIVALLLYAVNEFILQRYYPSWLSGKLSDFAWLFIAPVLLTLFFSLIIPSKRQTNTTNIPILAYTVVSLFFIGLKTIPAVNNFILLCWLSVFHFPAAVVMDVSDLFALLVVPLSFILWQRKEVQSNNLLQHPAIIISLFAILSLADASAPIHGIHDLSIQHDQIIAQTNFQGLYFSEDGGLSWTDCSINSKCLATTIESEPNKSIRIPETNIQYRINDYGMVEISQDAGFTWESLYSSRKYFSDAAKYYQLQTRPNAVITNPGAQDALYDPISGNVIIAMGLQGVIIIEPDGKIIQVGIGENQPTNLADPGVVLSILFPFFFLSLAIIAIYYASIVITAKQKSYLLLSILALLAWGYLTSTFPDLFTGYGFVFGIPLLLVVIGLIIWILIHAIKEIKKLQPYDKSKKWKYLQIALPGGILFFLCYILWYINIIPNLEWAMYISFLVVLLWFIFCTILSFRFKNNQQR